MSLHPRHNYRLSSSAPLNFAVKGRVTLRVVVCDERGRHVFTFGQTALVSRKSPCFSIPGSYTPRFGVGTLMMRLFYQKTDKSTPST